MHIISAGPCKGGYPWYAAISEVSRVVGISARHRCFKAVSLVGIYPLQGPFSGVEEVFALRNSTDLLGSPLPQQISRTWDVTRRAIPRLLQHCCPVSKASTRNRSRNKSRKHAPNLLAMGATHTSLLRIMSSVTAEGIWARGTKMEGPTKACARSTNWARKAVMACSS